MIRIFKLVLLLVVSQVAFGQAPSNYTNINGRYRWIAGMFDSTFHIPKGTTNSLRVGGSTNAGALFYNTTDSTVYTYTGTQWIKLRGVVIDTTSLSNRINLKLNISDTAAMLAPYLRKVDTASLSNRINLKLNISDTATMLGNYLNNVGYGLIRSGQVVRADSATLASYFLRRKDSLTTTNPLGYVTRTILADTAAAIRSSATSGFVPYTGATQNVNLGQFGLTTKFVQFDTSSQAVTDRRLQWSNDDGTLQFGMTNGATITQRIGLEQFARVKNVDATQINKGEAVYIFGASGDRASVKKADNRQDATSSKTLGVAAEDIPVNDVGLVGTFGVVSNLNLNAYTAGDILYLDSIPGGLTKNKPQAPYHLVFIGVVERANSGNGLLFVNPQNGYELEELHNVRITSPVRNNALLIYDSTRSLWIDTTIAQAGLAVTQVNTNSGSGITGGPITTVGTIAADTLVLSTRAWRQKGIDSVQSNLTSGLALKVNISDTASMLSPYLRSNVAAATYVPQTRTITINGTSQDLSANRTFSVGTVTSVGITAGTGISVANSPVTGSGNITVTNTAPDQTVALTAGTGITIGGTYPSFTITNSSPSSGGTVTSVATNNGTGITGGTITGAGTLAIDTVVISTRAWRQKGIDSVQGNLTAGLALKLNISDTANMLLPYLRKVDTASLSNRINLKVNISDTASMLNPYLRKVDTASLSNRINLKLNISDTASMLSPYLRKIDTASLSNRINLKVNISDTANMLNPYLRKVDTASLSNRINTKLNISDTATMLGNYVNNVGYGLSKVSQVVSADSATLASYFLRRKDSLTATNLLGYVTGKILADTAAAVRAAAGGGSIGGSGTANYVAKFTSSTAVGNSRIFDDGTNVGIGLTTASHPLTVLSNSSSHTIKLLGDNSANISMLTFSNNADNANYGIIQGRPTEFRIFTASNPITFTPSTVEAMRLISGGSAATMVVGNGQSAAIPFTGIIEATDGSGSNVAGAELRIQGGQSTGSGAGGPITFYTSAAGTAGTSTNAATERMRLDASGNLGINTSSPSYKLDVNGTGRFSDNLTVTKGSPAIDITSSSGTGYALLTANNNAGFLRVGRDNSSGSLYGTAYASLLISQGSYPLFFGTNDAVRATLDTSGNLGLGVTPSAWSTGKAFEVGALGNSLWGVGGGDILLGSNFYYNADFKYASSNYATGYRQQDGVHKWLISSSGTANATISFTQAMTLDASGNLGIGTTSPSAKLEVNVGLNSLKISGRNTYVNSSEDALNSNIYVTQDGVGNFNQEAGHLVLQARTQGTVYRDIIFAGGLSNGTALMTILGEGNVGIGTTSPTQSLEVNGNILVAQSAGNYPRFISTVGAKSWEIGYRSGTTNYEIREDGTTRMVIANGGNVGIGTSSPNRLIEIASTSGGVLGVANSNASGGSGILYGRIAMYSTAGSNSYIDYGGEIRSYSGAGIDYSDLRFYTGNGATSAERMRITSGGNVGIGTTSPTRLLHIDGGASGTYFMMSNNASGSGASDGFQIIQDGSTTEVVNRENGPIITYTNNAERMRITSGGNVGIGTSSPTQKLEVAGVIRGEAVNVYGSTDPASTSPYLYSPSLGALGFGANGSERMRLTSGGNVGIGTTSPSGRLHIDPADNEIGLNVSTSSLTGSNAQSLIDLAQTWNTTGNPTAIKLNITNTASGATANLMDLQVGGTSEFKVTKEGYVGINQGTPTSTLHTEGSVANSITTKSANYTLTSSDYTVGFDCASDRTATLPDATTCKGRIYVIYQYNTGSGTRGVTIDPNGAQTIDGNADAVLTGLCDYTSVMIQSDGSNWVIISDSIKGGCN